MLAHFFLGEISQLTPRKLNPQLKHRFGQVLKNNYGSVLTGEEIPFYSGLEPLNINPDIGFLTVHSLNDNVKLKISKVREIQELPLDYFELKYGVYNLKAFKEGFEP